MIASMNYIKRNALDKAGKLIILLFLGVFLSHCKKENLDLLEYPSYSFNIKELELRVEDLNANRVFWNETMGFPLVDQTSGSFTVQIGESRLKFIPKNTTNPPIYHFSISIPQNQVEKALDWLKNDGNKYPDGPTQPITIIKDELSGAEIISKPLYNANSVFFADAAGNVIELIARNNIDNAVEGNFSMQQFLKISEVSVVTKQVRQCEEMLDEEFGAKAFPRTTSGYKPVGGAEGVFLLVIPGRPWIPTESNLATEYETIITVQDSEEKEFMLPGSLVTVKTEL
jgi:catechol 2,3-dioxygenase-like lactoylglutathione lyase family enzyme